VFDVAVTGDKAFAENGALVQSIAENARRAESGAIGVTCQGHSGVAGWDCQLDALAGALPGGMVTIDLETIQNGQKQLETLSCGPVTETFQAACADKTRGIGFQGAQIIEHPRLKSDESWESAGRMVCEPQKPAGEPC
jgi:hypothetical protein